MSAHQDLVVAAVLSLSPEERERLADRLLASLHSETGNESLDPVAEHRLDALRRGDSEFLSELHELAQV